MRTRSPRSQGEEKMAYSDRTDIENTIGRTRLVELTDVENTGEVDDAAVAAAIEDADSVIDGYCKAGGYAVPLDPVPSIIKRLSCRLAVYFLKDSRGLATDSDVKNYEDMKKTLVDISKGIMKIGTTLAAPATTEESGIVRTTKSESGKTYSDEILEQF